MTFPDTTFAYLADLAAHNEKAWFDANRDRYQAEWLDPAQAFVTQWAPFMAGLMPPHKAEPRVNGSIRRINRDVRFSKDKRPYDARVHLVFWAGDHPNRSPAIHVIVRPDGVAMGAGQWDLGKGGPERYRRAVVDPARGAELGRIVDGLEGLGLGLTAETLKKLPPGAPADTGRDTLLKRKGLVMTTGDAPYAREVLADEAFLRERFTAMAVLDAWLMGLADD